VVEVQNLGNFVGINDGQDNGLVIEKLVLLSNSPYFKQQVCSLAGCLMTDLGGGMGLFGSIQ
jgi:hypothetical protein